MSPDALFRHISELGTAGLNVFIGVVDALPVSYAFGAGMIASANPCGFIMLPAFIGFFITSNSPDLRLELTRRLGRAGWFGLLVTAAFIATFAAMGLAVTLGGRALMEWTGWAGIIVGVLLATFGLYQLVFRRSLFSGMAAGVRVRRDRSTRGALLFGLAYGVCSLGCTLPAFLVVAGGVFVGNAGFAESMWRFVEYGAGMGFVLAVVALAVAVFQEQGARTFRRFLPAAEFTANAMLVLAGAYIVWYWTANGPLL